MSQLKAYFRLGQLLYYQVVPYKYSVNCINCSVKDVYFESIFFFSAPACGVPMLSGNFVINNKHQLVLMYLAYLDVHQA